MDKSMESMLDMYLFETNTLLEQLDEILLNAEKNRGFTEENINEIFRIMHTIKGSSAMMEFDSIMTIAHKVEDLFYTIREDGINEEYSDGLFELMFVSSDFIKSEIDKVQNNEPLTSNIESFQKKISDFVKKIKNISDDTLDTEGTTSVNGDDTAEKSYPYSVKVFFEEGCGMENLRSFMLVESIKDVCTDFTYYPPNVDTDSSTANTIIYDGFVISFATEAELNSAVSTIRGALNIKTYEVLAKAEPAPVVAENTVVDEAEQKTPETAQKKEVSDKPKEVKKPSEETPAAMLGQQANSTAASSKQSLISVNLSKLDKLMDIVGEIVITESMVTSSPDIKDLKLDNFTKSARQLRKLTDELQNIVMSVRMIPVAGVFQKMNRIVRDMSHKLGKAVTLELIGEDTEMDKTIVDSISDPIMHLIRNAMDHGIESDVQDRLDYGKSEQGKITLMAQHTGSVVLITITDDGKGVDPEKVLAKAKANGILTKPENEYTTKEILMLLMTAGFSTKEEVTEFSGRGVGMDVVRKNVEKVGGVVSIASELHRGTTVTFKIPLTLAIISGMEVSVGSSIFTIPINNIKQSFKVSKEDVVYDSDKNEMIYKTGEYYPVIRLHEFYEIEPKSTNIEDGMIIWVEAGEKAYCLLVDELLGEQQVVVKPLPEYVNNFNIKNSGIAGCTILGNGSISIILDIQNLHEVSSNR